MTRDEIESKIKEILVSDFELDAEKLVPGAKLFEDLDLDSIDAVDMVVRLQQMTGLKVKAEDFKQIRTLDDVVGVVEKLVNEQGK
ncbi:MAG: acyl carrier protein [Kiritimatiellae bacterium]|jgi:acyl carrier protein|nr:acyl carrier protein [Kiritimatiellia bacterium]